MRDVFLRSIDGDHIVLVDESGEMLGAQTSVKIVQGIDEPTRITVELHVNPSSQMWSPPEER